MQTFGWAFHLLWHTKISNWAQAQISILQTLKADVLPNCSWSDHFRHEVARTLLCLSLFVIHVLILINSFISSSSNTSIMTVESQFITMPVLKEMLAMQKESYQSSLKLIMDSVKTEVKELRREVQEMKESVSFISGKYDDVKMKFDVTESKIKAAFIQIEGLNKDINENLDEIEVKQEYLENHSRRNNIKLLGVPEDDDENSWDDTELIVKTLIKNKLGIQDEVATERAHRVGKKVQPRPQSKKEHGSHVESASTPRTRPIIAKIQFWKVKENILRIARKKKPNNVLFVNDFSQRTLEKRAENISKMLEERKKGNVAFLHMDKLIVYEKKRNRNSDDCDNEVIIQGQ